jgi:hypothetical protein
MVAPAVVAGRDVVLAQRAAVGLLDGQQRPAQAAVDVLVVDLHVDGLAAARALAEGAADHAVHLALHQQVLVQRRDLDHLLALLARGQHRAGLPVVQVEGLLREARVLLAAELAVVAQGRLVVLEVRRRLLLLQVVVRLLLLGQCW